ncbi:MAG: sporulation integral membrane protein YlbJ [Clostridia bacterium]|nr:sporulation integral membrane protein YlbJ [Clostridia bacterium]
MNNIKIIVFNIKKLFIPICICLFIIFLLIFSNANLSSAKAGLALWANSVIPSLLPFFIATELLGYTNIISVLGKLLNKLMRPLFNVPGEGAFPFIMGIISGYPMGAKIVSNFKAQGICTDEEAERLLAFTNNSGPLFIIGTVGIGLFKDTSIGILLFITHILACLTVAFLFRFWKSSKRYEKKGDSPLFSQPPVSISNLGEVLATSIMSAINTIFLIGGFIVLFSVVISILQNSGVLDTVSRLIHPILNILNIPLSFDNEIFTGLLEVTNGVCNIANITNKSISTNIIICAFLLGFGGISIMLQILSIVSKAKISIKPYIIGKLLQGIFAALYTYIFIYTVPFLNLNL